MRKTARPVPQKKPSLLRVKKWSWPEWLGLVFWLGTVFILLRFIWGPSAAFLHSDSTDTLLWAKASLEAGRTFSPDFHYAALLPFGAGLWYVPLLAVGGFTVKVQLWGLTIFLFLFTASLIFFFRSLDWRWGESFAATGICLMLFSGSVKLREIFWGHVIYYSLGLMLLALALGLVFRQKRRRRKKWPLILFFGLLNIGAGTNGVQFAAVYMLPLLLGFVLELFLSADRKAFQRHWDLNGPLIIQLLAGSALGLIILTIMRRGGIYAGYAEAFSRWSKSADWPENFRKIIPDFLDLCGVRVGEEHIHMVSFESIGLMLLIGASLFVLLAPLVALAKYRQIQDEKTRLLLLVHAVNAGIIVFLYIFGLLSLGNWRLTPLLGTGLWANLAFFRERLYAAAAAETETGVSADSLRRPAYERPSFRWAALFLLMFLLAAGVNMLKVSAIKPQDAPNYAQRQTDLQYMQAHELKYGFATFWNANVYTLLSDEATKVRDITIDKQGVHKRLYQSQDSWFEPQPGVTEYFLLLTGRERDELRASDEWADLAGLLLREEKAGQHYFLYFDARLIPHLAS